MSLSVKKQKKKLKKLLDKVKIALGFAILFAVYSVWLQVSSYVFNKLPYDVDQLFSLATEYCKSFFC